jgi:hypothetical protein
VLRSQHQGEILALLLGDPDQELSLMEIARRTGAPHLSVFREVQRAELAGLVVSRRAANSRLVRANTGNPYYAGLAEVLTLAFGVPAVLAKALGAVQGVGAAYLVGAWAARYAGHRDMYPAGDIEVLIVGDPPLDGLRDAALAAQRRLGRPVRMTVGEVSWLETGAGPVYLTAAGLAILRLSLPPFPVIEAAGDRRASEPEAPPPAPIT